MSATYTAARPATIGSLLGHGVLATVIATAATPSSPQRGRRSGSASTSGAHRSPCSASAR